MKTQCRQKRFVPALAAVLAVSALGPGRATAQSSVTKVNDAAAGDRVPKGLSTSDWSSIRAAYEAGRHAAFAKGGGYQTRNPGQQWRTRFDGRGFLTTPDAGVWSWGLDLISYGRVGAEQSVTAPSCVDADGSRVSYQWNDTLTEWYVNDRRGLEHGYTVHQRPEYTIGGTPVAEYVALTSRPKRVVRASRPWMPRGDQSPDRFNQSPDRQGGVGSQSQGPAHLDGNRFLTVAALNNAHSNDTHEGGRQKRTGETPMLPIGGTPMPPTGETPVPPIEFTGGTPVPHMQSVPHMLSVPHMQSVPPLQLTLAVRGDLHPRVSAGGSSVTFVNDSGAAVVNYHGLSVHDASGAAVPAWFEPAAGDLRLVVDDSSARYPLTIDPVAQQAYLKASNTGVGDRFGASVAASGNTVVVGAFLEDSRVTEVNGNQADNSASAAGAVYVFVRNAAGVWSQQAYLKASNTDAIDLFGISVAVSGDTVVVGARGEDSSATGVNGNQSNSFLGKDSGAAYVFVRVAGGVWKQQAYLKASNTDSGDQFGTSVAVSGDTVVIGANREASSATGVDGNQADNSATQAGAAYVFVRGAGGVWSQQAYLKASNTGGGVGANPGDQFGTSVAVSGNTVVVGASGESSSTMGVGGNQADNSALFAGATYVFVRDAGGLWSQQAYLKASNTDSGDQFGTSVAASGDTVVVGAPNEDSSDTGGDGNQADNSAVNAGAAYVFIRDTGGIWSQQTYLKASNTDNGDQFGVSVAISGGRVVVGALGEASSASGTGGNQADNSASFAGAAYVFVRDVGGVWSQQAYLKASNTDSGDQFGISAAVSGDTVVVGADIEDSSATGIGGNQADNSTNAAGAAYVFVLPDCNANGIPDNCDISCGNAGGPCDVPGCGGSSDCNANGIPDECELTTNDCNANGVPDECEPDGDGDGVIDACDNCPSDFNPGQHDSDNNGIGDLCDTIPPGTKRPRIHPASSPGRQSGPRNSQPSPSSTSEPDDKTTPAPGIGMLTGGCAPVGAVSMSMCLVGILLMQWNRRRRRRR